MSIEGAVTVLFGNLGEPLSKLCGDLEAADIRIYPRVYGSVVILFTVAATFVSLLGSVLLMAVGVFSPLVGIGLLLLPVTVLMGGILWPRIKMADRGASLSSEVPYAAAYTAVMSTGGISPYVSILRLSRAPLLPTFRKMARLLDVKVRGLGADPVTALEDIGKTLPSAEFKELLLGYASTLRAGGDVVHYLLRRTEVLFRERLSGLKTVGERVGQLMEIYMTFGILLSLGIYSIYAIQLALGSAFAEMQVGIFGNVGFFMGFAYFFLPFLSVIFLWLVDISQPKYPTEENSVYFLFMGTCIPVALLVLPGLFLSFPIPELLGFPLYNAEHELVVSLTSLLNLERGFEGALGLLITLVVVTIPAAAYRLYISWKEGGMEFGFANFLRDLVEIRKSGLSPEKCIMSLADRNYGNLSRFIRTVSRQVSWGVSYSRIYQDFSKNVRSWLSKVSMFLLLDAIEVGGGTPETLETLAQFNESIVSMEKEKNSMLKPLLVIPYIGTAVLVFTIITLLTFFRSMLGVVSKSIGFADIVTLLLPPLIIHIYAMGIVGGKISSGEVSGGFLHSILLLLFTLFMITLVPYFSIGIVPAPVG